MIKGGQADVHRLSLGNEAKSGTTPSQPVNGLQRTNLTEGLGCGKDWQRIVRRDKFSRMGQANLKTPSHITDIAPWGHSVGKPLLNYNLIAALGSVLMPFEDILRLAGGKLL